jgi:hypothetical protein
MTRTTRGLKNIKVRPQVLSVYGPRSDEFLARALNQIQEHVTITRHLNPPQPNKEYDTEEGNRHYGPLDENRDFHNFATFKPESGDFDPVQYRKPPVTT